MSDYSPYNITLTVTDPGDRNRFRNLSRPETYYEIRPNRSPGQSGAYRIELNDAEHAQALRDAADPSSNLLVIQKDSPLIECSGVPNAAAMTYMAADQADSLGMTGAGVIVGVADGGIGLALKNSVFSGRVVAGKSFVNDTNYDPYVDSSAQFPGHGSKMASLAVPPRAKLAVAQVSSPEGSSATLAAGIYWLADEVGADVINVSIVIGGDGAAQAVVTSAVANAASKGSVLMAAAGNQGHGITMYPAGDQGAFSIANFDYRTDGPAPDSNFGSHMYAAASGMAQTTYQPDGSTEWLDNSGTSGATAVASNIVARLISSGMGPAPAITALKNSARKTGAGGLYEGAGVLQLAAVPPEEPEPEEPEEPEPEPEPDDYSDCLDFAQVAADGDIKHYQARGYKDIWDPTTGYHYLCPPDEGEEPDPSDLCADLGGQMVDYEKCLIYADQSQERIDAFLVLEYTKMTDPETATEYLCPPEVTDT